MKAPGARVCRHCPLAWLGTESLVQPGHHLVIVGHSPWLKRTPTVGRGSSPLLNSLQHLPLAGGSTPDIHQITDFQRRTSGLGLAWGAEGGLVLGEALDFGLHELEAGLFGRQFGFVWFC